MRVRTLFYLVRRRLEERENSLLISGGIYFPSKICFFLSRTLQPPKYPSLGSNRETIDKLLPLVLCVCVCVCVRVCVRACVRVRVRVLSRRGREEFFFHFSGST